jgi:NAD(P)-dependent dehydrogenase (short-subunit alcohol dehydrogenase family)
MSAAVFDRQRATVFDRRLHEAFCKRLVEDARKGLGGLDILVNVAGHQIACEDIAELTTEQFDETFRTNVYA